MRTIGLTFPKEQVKKKPQPKEKPQETAKRTK